MWKPYNVDEIEECKEVLAYSPKWINEDFNPTGVRIGFVTDGEFISAVWNNYHDTYDAEDDIQPVAYMEIPEVKYDNPNDIGLFSSN